MREELERGTIRVIRARARGRGRAVNKLYAVTRAGADLSPHVARLLALLQHDR